MNYARGRNHGKGMEALTHREEEANARGMAGLVDEGWDGRHDHAYVVAHVFDLKCLVGVYFELVTGVCGRE